MISAHILGNIRNPLHMPVGECVRWVLGIIGRCLGGGGFVSLRDPLVDPSDPSS